ncbi:MAG: sigma-70 family RNA polymerase sigma factor [Verrucomicrobiales bacterium]
MGPPEQNNSIDHAEILFPNAVSDSSISQLADEPPTETNLFPDTHWSAVRKLRGDDPEAARIALDSLCAAYWQPICQYIRYRGQSADQAEDLTQEFFHQQMVRPKNVFHEVRQERGRLRTYVCVAVKRHVADAVRHKTRLKRGGGVMTFSLRDESDSFQSEVADPDAPDRQFDRRWTEALIKRTLVELEREYVARGKQALFDELKGYLSVDEAIVPQAEAAERLGMKIGTLRMNLNRIRERFGEIFRKKVAETVPSGSQEEIDAEIEHLMRMFG